MNLYEVATNLQQVNSMLDQWDGEDEELKTALDDTLESLELTLEDKVDGYASLIKNLEAENDAFKKEIDRMNARRKTNDNKIKWLKSTLENSLRMLDIKKAKGQKFSATLSAGAGKLELKVPESELPEEYQKVTITADKTKLKELLKAENATENDMCCIVKTESLRVR